jgi:hypothetical protein
MCSGIRGRLPKGCRYRIKAFRATADGGEDATGPGEGRGRRPLLLLLFSENLVRKSACHDAWGPDYIAVCTGRVLCVDSW